MAASQQWDPGQYNRFAAEREKPFFDLVDLLEPVVGGDVVDLGCGDGRLTSELHHRVGARRTRGVDSSPEMLADAAARATEGLTFEAGDLGTWAGHGVDVVFSNAALHWVGDHEAVLARWRDALGSGGQLAVQVPASADHPSHRIARRLADEWLGSAAPLDPVAEHVLPPERYAEVLDALGFGSQHVRLQVYGHRLATTGDVVEWMRGTSLTRFRAVLPPDDYEQFLEEYRRRLLVEIGDRPDYFFAFKRILFWGRLS